MRARINSLLDATQDITTNLKSKVGLAVGRYVTYKIVSPEEIGQPVCIFKSETTEKVKLMRVLDFIEEGDFTLIYPEINLWYFENASFIGRNDFVIKDNKVFWNKIKHYNFPKNLPLDFNLIQYNQKTVTIKGKKTNKCFDVAFSLLGVHATVWSHSLSEYYTKIPILSKVLERETGVVKVLVPFYKELGGFALIAKPPFFIYFFSNVI